VLASSSRLWQLADTDEDTSPFLDGFTPPLTIGVFEDDEARQLIRQSRLHEASRPDIADDEIEFIRDVCGNHPYQIQLLCRRFLDCGNMDAAVDEVAHDRAVGFFFAVDMELLGESERHILRFLADRPGGSLEALKTSLGESSGSVATRLSALHELGFIRKDADGRHGIASQFLRRWLGEEGSTS
jgi:hypothetical protein